MTYLKSKKFSCLSLGLFLVAIILVPTLALAQPGGLPGGAGNGSGGNGGPSGGDIPGGDGGSGTIPNNTNQGCDLSTATFKTLVDCVRDSIVVPIINLLLALAVLVFFWGLVKYLYKGDNDAERTKGKSLMAFGIIGLFVMVSVWGIVGLLTGTFFGASGPAGVNPPVPQLPASITL
ncbi:MAG: hypothetical protein K8Q91_01040 [Candidatus Vogelbacteria bacterium]|nr:hypothetical protein [Candidatus Vogelbacteria bacterium]